MCSILMIFGAAARLSLGLVTVIILAAVSFLLFQAFRDPVRIPPFTVDFCMALLGSSMVLGWVGVGLWMGIILLAAAFIFLSLGAFMGLVWFWPLLFALLGLAFFSQRFFSQRQLFLAQHSALVEEWEKRSNDLRAGIATRQTQQEALTRKIQRFETLEEFTVHLSRNLSLQETIDGTLAQVVQMTPADQHTCLLYLVDNEQQGLSLKGSLRPKGGTIKHKKGDLLDYWVLKQRQPLLVEDTQKDFRFNIEAQDAELRRGFRSLIAAPLIDEKGIIGVLRMDSPNPRQFSPEELRVLTIIADLSTTAIRNATLFALTQELAIRDGLTGLYVYRHFMERLQEEIQRSFRSGKPLSLILVDIDWFKKYNDRFGHISGDIVLKQLGKRLLGWAQQGEIIARYGGEEFAMILPGCDARSGFARAEKIRRNVEAEIFWLRQEPTKVAISLGVSTFPGEARDREELIRAADQALYKAKVGGRNRTCSHSLS
ncbi:MAG: sensor domain-containing diguanylate cyclase [Candidatus Omnitrophica bacterium]|nr:sensor domain-containing diguanylate cyclase [Candidatus Omnitrophota bacterium]